MASWMGNVDDTAKDIVDTCLHPAMSRETCAISARSTIERISYHI